jgi:hypothetical protein
LRNPLGELFDSRAFGAVVAGQDDAHAPRLGFQHAVKPCLAGEQYVSPSRCGVRQKIIAGSAGYGHASDRLPGIAGELDARISQCP